MNHAPTIWHWLATFGAGLFLLLIQPLVEAVIR